MIKPKVAFIIQRAGKEIAGGAEAYCFEIAKRMSKYWDVEIITTCALDYTTWDNYYDEGIETVDGININRFRIDEPREWEKFNKLFPKNIAEAKLVTEANAEKIMQLQGPISSSLIVYLKEKYNFFDKFLFFTYLYAPTFFGLPIVAGKSYLVPTAHDEAPIYFPIWDEWFKKPQGFIFNTIEEKQFLEKRFPDIDFSGEITGLGITKPKSYSNIKFRQKYDIYAPYMLYIGRIDMGKGCDELFTYFNEFKRKKENALKLVLIGKNVIDIPDSIDIIHLGFVDEQTKFAALEGCEFLVNPSPFESLSIVLLEAWSVNKPVLVNAKSEVLVGQSKRSGGGLPYRNYMEFEQHALTLLEESYANKGLSDFVEKSYNWAVIEEKYIKSLAE